MKTISYITILFVFVFTNSHCQHIENLNDNFIQYKDIVLSEQDLEQFFKVEGQAFDSTLFLGGKINVFNDLKVLDFEREITHRNNDTLRLEDILSKFDPLNGVMISSLPEEDFLRYYKSLSDDRKQFFLSKDWGVSKRQTIPKTSRINKFILSEYERFKKTDKGRNSMGLYKIDYLLYIEHEGFIDSVKTFLSNVKSSGSNFRNAKFIQALIDHGYEQDALDLFKDLWTKFLEYEKTGGKDNYYLIPTGRTEFYYDFLTSKTPGTKEIFINFIIEIIEEDVFETHNIKSMALALWNSGTLSEKQKESLIGILEHSKFEKNRDLAEYFKKNLLKTAYLEQFSKEKIESTLSFSDLYPIVLADLNEEEIASLKDFIKANEKVLKKNTKYYDNRLYNLNKSLYKPKLKEVQDDFNKLGYHVLIPEDSLKLIYFKKERSSKPYRKGFLVRQVINRTIPTATISAEFDVGVSDFERVISDFIEKTKQAFNIKITCRQTISKAESEKENKEDIVYDFYIYSKEDKIYHTKLDEGAYLYSPVTLVNILNLILKDHNIDKRWMFAESPDPSYHHLLMEPGAFKILHDKYDLSRF